MNKQHLNIRFSKETEKNVVLTLYMLKCTRKTENVLIVSTGKVLPLTWTQVFISFISPEFKFDFIIYPFSWLFLLIFEFFKISHWAISQCISISLFSILCISLFLSLFLCLPISLSLFWIIYISLLLSLYLYFSIFISMSVSLILFLIWLFVIIR